MPAWFTRLVQTLPSQCLACRSWARAPLCEPCAAQAPRPQARCQRCALPLPVAVAAHSAVCGACLATPPPLAACAAAVSYAAPWIDCIAAFKFHGQVGLGWHLAARMWHHPALMTIIQRCDGLVPMPLTRQRLAQRGYNQALALAQPLAGLSRRALDTRSLLRLHERVPQRTLKRRERAANVQGVFAVPPERRAHLAGRHIALVDDVMTSGASLHAAAQCLLQAGAQSVSAVVFARTAEHD